MNPFERISIHKIKYILDKQLIMKMNNPIRSLHSSVEYTPSITALKSQPLLMNKSNSFDDEIRNQNKSIFQSGHFGMCNSVHKSINGSSNLVVYKEDNLKARLT